MVRIGKKNHKKCNTKLSRTSCRPYPLFALLLLTALSSIARWHGLLGDRLKSDSSCVPSTTTGNEEDASDEKDSAGASTSIFNCDGEYGQCKYFHPFEFFNGTGSEFRPILQGILDLKKKKKLWPRMPRIGFPTFSFHEGIVNPNTGEPFHRHNVSFIHVHKAGGTSVIQARKKSNVTISRHPVYSARFQRDKTLTYHHLETADKYKATLEEWGPDSHVMFAVIRDPLDRFISSLGQAMGATGSSSNAVGGPLRSECINGTKYTIENSQNTLACSINYVKNNGFYFEVHFTPQAVEIGFATQPYDVPVAVFQFEKSHQNVLREMGADLHENRRDGKEGGYRPSPVLTNMTSADYTPDMVRQICELYQVDVIMFRSLGWDVPRCKGFV